MGNFTEQEYEKLMQAILAAQEFQDEVNKLMSSSGTEVKNMARLPRSRKGKTPIDVGIVQQDGTTRVRISMGEDGSPGRKNSDLDVRETEDLVTMLTFNIGVAKGEIDIS